MWCTMDSLSLSLMILVLFVSLLIYFATVKWGDSCETVSVPTVKSQVSDTVQADFLRLQRHHRSMSVSRDYVPVLRQNVAVARLMRMEDSSLI